MYIFSFIYLYATTTKTHTHTKRCTLDNISLHKNKIILKTDLQNISPKSRLFSSESKSIHINCEICSKLSRSSNDNNNNGDHEMKYMKKGLNTREWHSHLARYCAKTASTTISNSALKSTKGKCHAT